MKRKFFAAFLSLCMVMSLVPMTALAAEGDVAQVGDKTYSTLQDAFNAAENGQEIQLLNDTNLDTWISVTKTLTLDLNGNSIISNGPVFSMNTEGIEFTIQDETNQGSVRSTASGYGNLIKVYKGELIVEGGQFSNTGYVIYVCQTGTATVKGGTLTSTNASVLSTNGSAEGSDNYSGTAVMNVEGGTLTSTNDVTIYVPAGTLNVSGGEIEGVTAIYSKSGTATITGGTVTSEGAKADFTHSGNGCIATGDAMVIEACGYPNGEPVVRVSGGEFTSANGSAVAYYQYNNNKAQEISITGGTFSSNVDDYVPTGYACTESGTSWTVAEDPNGGMAVTAPTTSEDKTYSTLEGIYAGPATEVEKPSTGTGSGTEETAGSDVTVDLSTTDSTATTGTVELTVNADTAQSLANNNANSLVVKSDVGTVSLDSAALAELQDVTEPVVISIVATNEENAAPTWEVTVKEGEKDLFANTTDVEITITVTAPKAATPENTKVYCIDNGGMEDMNAELKDGRLTWTTKHLSTFAAVTLAENAEATWAVTNGTIGSGTLADALSAVKDNGGTITLLSDATLENANYTINKPVTILDDGTHAVTITANANDTNTTTPAFQVNAGGALTLNQVKMTIQGTAATGDNGDYNGQGLQLYNSKTSGTNGAALTLTNGASLTLKGLESGIVFPASTTNRDQYATVTLEKNSQLTIEDIDGNASNGGNWNIKEASSVTITQCGSHGLSTEILNIDHSDVFVDDTGYTGILAAEMSLTGSTQVTVARCGDKLPFESLYAPDGSSYKNAVELKGNDPTLTVTDSTLQLINNIDKNSKSINSIYVGNGKLNTSDTSTIIGTIETAERNTNTYYTVTYLNNGQIYKSIVVDKAAYTVLGEPGSLSGYTFGGWKSSENGHVYQGGDEIILSDNTTFTAVWSYTPPANPNYKITIGAMENGTVTANPTAAKAGATVTLTATPDEGYALSTLTVTDRFGDAVRVTEQANGTYTFPMPNGQVTVTATFVETEAPVAEPFVDVAEGDWFYDAVVYAYQNELMDGVGGNRFAPNSETTRAQLVTILYRLEGQPAVSGDLPFTDVESGTWYTDAILWAAQNNIVNGVSDTEFAPGDDLTRQQLVTILYRYAEAKGYDVSASADLSGYPDADQVQDYAQPAMAWAVAENIIQGMEDGTLKPAGNASRAQIATILMRFCEDVAQ